MTSSKLDLTGQRFKMLLVLEEADNITINNKTYTAWKCRCDCGVVKIIPTHYLRRPSRVSCGCKEVQGNSKPQISTDERLYNLKRYEAQRRNLEFTLTYKGFMSLVSADCHYCGLPPSQLYRIQRTGTEVKTLYNGIDRVENNIGYTPDNSVACCTHCNQMKLAYSYDAFLEKIISIYNRRCLGTTLAATIS